MYQKRTGLFTSTTGTGGQNSFSETAKSESNEQASRISSAMPLMKLNFSVISAGNPVLLDGVISQFDSAYAAGVDVNDNLKIGNCTSKNISSIGIVEIMPNPLLNKDINLSFQNQPLDK